MYICYYRIEFLSGFGAVTLPLGICIYTQPGSVKYQALHKTVSGPPFPGGPLVGSRYPYPRKIRGIKKLGTDPLQSPSMRQLQSPAMSDTLTTGNPVLTGVKILAAWMCKIWDATTIYLKERWGGKSCYMPKHHVVG